jgi:hypothetical protein
MSFAAAEKLLGIEKELNNVVVGQGEAISSIARALRRSRANLGDPKRPIGSFLFLGPTGVGKTLLAKMLAEKVYGDPKALISLDMTEFSDKFTSSRLVGARRRSTSSARAAKPIQYTNFSQLDKPPPTAPFSAFSPFNSPKRGKSRARAEKKSKKFR